MKIGLLPIFIFCFAWHSHAQEMIFTTKPAATKVGIQDRFEVRYSIQNGNSIRKFSLPTITDFDIVGGPSQSNSTSYSNGERTSSIDITYIFKAKRKGTLVIPGGIAFADGKTYHSNDVQIEVIDGSVSKNNRSRQPSANPFFDDPFFDDPFGGGDPFAAMQQQHQQMMKQLQRMQQQAFGAAPPATRGNKQRTYPQPEIISKKDVHDNIFIKVDVDKHKVALGEQITAVYKLYARMPMEVNLTKLPSLVGFWSQDFKIPQPPKPTREVLNGKEYQVFILKKSALFPTQTGTLMLDPAAAEGIVKVLSEKKVKQDNPFESFFGGGSFGDQYVSSYDYESVPVHLKSAAIPIEVSDLPNSNKPKNFNGAVGNYTLDGNIDKTELTTDESAVLTLRISGSGNLKLIGTPAILFPDDLNTYDPVIQDTITNTNNIIAGYKTFSYTLSPRVAGVFTIPATEFSFFEPTSNSYKTLTTPSYTLHVKPGKGDAQLANKNLPKDIHDIYTKPISISKSSNIVLPTSGWYWGGFALPLFAYIGLIAWKRKEEKLSSNSVLFRNKRANKVALKRLASAENYLQQGLQHSFYEETSKAVWLYVSDKLNIPLASLSKEVADSKLTQNGVDEHTKQEIFRITDECEIALYSPDRGALKMHQTYSDSIRLISTLEDKLS